MSADNYNLVKKIGDSWHVYLSLSASCSVQQNLEGASSDRIFGNCDDAVKWADEQGYAEYGTSVYDPAELARETADEILDLLAQLQDDDTRALCLAMVRAHPTPALG